MDIEVAEEQEDGALVLLPVGRLDSANARAFEAIVMDRIGARNRPAAVSAACGTPRRSGRRQASRRS